MTTTDIPKDPKRVLAVGIPWYAATYVLGAVLAATTGHPVPIILGAGVLGFVAGVAFDRLFGRTFTGSWYGTIQDIDTNEPPEVPV